MVKHFFSKKRRLKTVTITKNCQAGSFSGNHFSSFSNIFNSDKISPFRENLLLNYFYGKTYLLQLQTGCFPTDDSLINLLPS